MIGDRSSKSKNFDIDFRGKTFTIESYDSNNNVLHGRNGYVQFFSNGSYAIKVLYKANDKEKYDRFKEEIEVLSKLSNQPDAQNNGVVKLLDSHLPSHSTIKNGTDHVWYIMPKLIPFNQLESHSLLDILKILKDIFKAICFIHKNNYSHRDIKLENILHDSNGKWFLCDFGLVIDSKCLLNQRLSHDKESIGPSGRPPELEKISMGTDPVIFMKSDIYLFGKLCWQLLTNYNSFFNGPFLFHTFALSKIEEAAKRFEYPIFPLIQLMFESIQDNLYSRCNEERIKQLLDNEENVIQNNNQQKYLLFPKQRYYFFKNKSNYQQEVYTNKEEIYAFFKSIESIDALITQNHQTQSFYTKISQGISNNEGQIQLNYQDQKIIGIVEKIIVIKETKENYHVKVYFTNENNCPIGKQFSLDKPPINDSPLYLTRNTILEFEI